MRKYIDKELADAMEVLRNNCIDKECRDCCFDSRLGCYLHRKAAQNWKTEVVTVEVQKYELKED